MHASRLGPILGGLLAFAACFVLGWRTAPNRMISDEAEAQVGTNCSAGLCYSDQFKCISTGALLCSADGGGSGGGSQFVGWYDAGSGAIQTAGAAVVIDAVGDVRAEGGIQAGGSIPPSYDNFQCGSPIGSTDYGCYYGDATNDGSNYLAVISSAAPGNPTGPKLVGSTYWDGGPAPTSTIQVEGGQSILIANVGYNDAGYPIATIQNEAFGSSFNQDGTLTLAAGAATSVEAVRASQISCPYGTGTLNADGGGGFKCNPSQITDTFSGMLQQGSVIASGELAGWTAPFAGHITNLSVTSPFAGTGAGSATFKIGFADATTGEVYLEFTTRCDGSSTPQAATCTSVDGGCFFSMGDNMVADLDSSGCTTLPGGTVTVQVVSP